MVFSQSLFEAHADVLVKDRRATYYGHKIFLTTGRSGLILYCAIPAAHSRLIREVVRTILTVQLQEHREAMLRATGGGALPSESSVDLAADEAFGQETIELIKQSRERRAGLQR